jgi:hypothetical protein
LTRRGEADSLARPGPWYLKRIYGLFPRLDERQALVPERGRVVFSGESETLRRDRSRLDK